jgi:hypothetical protein
MKRLALKSESRPTRKEFSLILHQTQPGGSTAKRAISCFCESSKL